MDVLGIELLRGGRRADDVGEERRDDLALLLGRRLGRGERRAACAAELEAVRVLLSAGRAGHHALQGTADPARVLVERDYAGARDPARSRFAARSARAPAVGAAVARRLRSSSRSRRGSRPCCWRWRTTTGRRSSSGSSEARPRSRWWPPRSCSRGSRIAASATRSPSSACTWRAGGSGARWHVVPHARVQTVDTKRGPLERALGLVSVFVTTASAKGGTGVPGLDPSVADALVEELARRAGIDEGT